LAKLVKSHLILRSALSKSVFQKNTFGEKNFAYPINSKNTF